jgi:hypothetical protein
MTLSEDLLSNRRNLKGITVEPVDDNGNRTASLLCSDGIVKRFTLNKKSFAALADALLAATHDDKLTIDWDLTKR